MSLLIMESFSLLLLEIIKFLCQPLTPSLMLKLPSIHFTCTFTHLHLKIFKLNQLSRISTLNPFIWLILPSLMLSPFHWQTMLSDCIREFSFNSQPKILWGIIYSQPIWEGIKRQVNMLVVTFTFITERQIMSKQVLLGII